MQPAIYDFGPGGAEPVVAQSPAATRSPLVVADIQSRGIAEGSTALHYRLAYDDVQQLRAYQRARWSQPPAELVRQAVTSVLARQWPVLDSRSAREAARVGGIGAGDRASLGSMLVLRLEIEEFSQVFNSPVQSSGVLRLRATLSETSHLGERLRGQRLFVVHIPAGSQDAAGGSAAMARAALQAAGELADWVGSAAH